MNSSQTAVSRMTEHVSLSRVRRRAQCARQDWWQTEGSRDGYRSDALPSAREAFALKKLTSLPAVIGEALHHAAAARARAVRDGRRIPTVERLREGICARLNRAVMSRDVAAFLKRPSETVMLREIFFEEWRGGIIPRDLVAETKGKVESLLERMLAHPVWEDIARCGRGDILVCDALDALEIELDGAFVRIYAAPDLVWVSNDPVNLPGFGIPLLPPVVSILDWKTGRAAAGQEEQARRQLCVYAWFTSQKLKLPHVPLAYVGRVAAIGVAGGSYGTGSDSDLSFVLYPADVDYGRTLIEQAAKEIVDARPPDGRVPMESTSRSLDACRWCPFTPLCHSADNSLVANESRWANRWDQLARLHPHAVARPAVPPATP